MGFTSLILSAILLGGTGSIYGRVAASLLLTIASELLAGSGTYRPIAIAVVIIVVMLVSPDGLLGLARAVRTRMARRRAVTSVAPEAEQTALSAR